MPQLTFPHTVTGPLGSSVDIKEHRNGGYTQYSIRYKQGRKTKRKVFSDPHKAIQWALGLISALDGSGGGASRETEELAYYRNLDARLPVNVSLADIVDLYLQAQAEQAELSAEATLQQVTEEWVATKEGMSPRYVSDARAHAAKLCTVFGADAPIADITPRDLDRYLSHFENPTTRNNHRRYLVGLWRWAQAKGYVAMDRITAAERTDTARQVIRDPAIVHPCTLETLLRGCEEHKSLHTAIPFLTIGAFAGARTSEILRMQWSDIHWEDEAIHLGRTRTKTRRARVIPITENLRQWLQEYGGRGDGPIVPGGRDWHHKWAAMRGEHGLPSLPPNGLRHSYASYASRVTGDLGAVAQAAGHSVAVLQSTYRSLVTTEAARAWFAIRPA